MKKSGTFFAHVLMFLVLVIVIADCRAAIAAENSWSQDTNLFSPPDQQVLLARRSRRTDEDSQKNKSYSDKKTRRTDQNTDIDNPMVKNSINLLGVGVIGPDISGSVFALEYERLLNRHLSVMARLGKLNYTYDDGTYVEDGDGSGVDLGVRFYPSGHGMKGFFLGGNIGRWSTDWEWTDDKGTPYESHGKGDTDSFKVELELGGRFNLGTQHVALTPALHIGSFLGQNNTDKETELGFFVLLGLSLGFGF